MNSPHELIDEQFLESLQGNWLEARHQTEGIVSGLHRSRHRGSGGLFVEHREYRPGDDPRKLDWRAFARTDRDVIRHHEQESQLRVHLLLDISASMDFGGGLEHKGLYAASLLSTIACALIWRGDAVGCTLFNDGIHRQLSVSSKPSQLLQICKMLDLGRRPSGFTSVFASLGTFAASAPHHGLVVVASDLIDLGADIYRALLQLTRRGTDVWVLQVMTREELELTTQQPAVFRGLEGELERTADPNAVRADYQREVHKFIRLTAAQCFKAGALHQLCPTDVRPEQTFGALLHHRSRKGKV